MLDVDINIHTDMFLIRHGKDYDEYKKFINRIKQFQGQITRKLIQKIK